jgi:hypothetical protein
MLRITGHPSRRAGRTPPRSSEPGGIDDDARDGSRSSNSLQDRTTTHSSCNSGCSRPCGCGLRIRKRVFEQWTIQYNDALNDGGTFGWRLNEWERRRRVLTTGETVDSGVNDGAQETGSALEVTSIARDRALGCPGADRFLTCHVGRSSATETGMSSLSRRKESGRPSRMWSSSPFGGPGWKNFDSKVVRW